ncbi:peptidylprolyl isomerase [Arenimonas composti]|nr:peptidylprolyl isomerase [Arenimonas composti]
MSLQPKLLTLVLTAALAAFATAPRAAEPGDASAQVAPRATTQQVLDASSPSDWRPLDPENTVVMTLASGDVIIELAPQFAPAHVANIRALARGGFWDGLSIYRGHDNFVVQWGDPEEDEAKQRAFPNGALRKLPAEFDIAAAGVPFTVLPDVDGWAPQVGFSNGMPAGRDPQAGRAWPLHCYGSVGAGRGLEADSSTGAELYAVIGQSPRQLDRNITTIGRVVFGMERLSVLPRGPGPLGFYEDQSLRTPIQRVRLLADIPEAERPRLEVLRTDTATWDALIEARRNRQDDFYKRPAGHIDVCNVPLPVREPS